MRDEAGQASVMARAAATVRLGGEGAEDRLTVDLVKPVLANESQSAGAGEWIFETGDLRAQVFFSSIDRGFQQFASAVSDKVVMRVGGVVRRVVIGARRGSLQFRCSAVLGGFVGHKEILICAVGGASGSDSANGAIRAHVADGAEQVALVGFVGGQPAVGGDPGDGATMLDGGGLGGQLGRQEIDTVVIALVDRKSPRLKSSFMSKSYAVFCL